MTSLFLKLEEKQLLFKKYVKAGYTKEEAKEKVRGLSMSLHKSVIKLNRQRKSEEYIEDKFKEKFAELRSRDGI